MFMPYLSKANDLLSLIKYLAFVVIEGDWLNDWLTHLPPDVAASAQVVGKFIADTIY